ncbi:hypothetical protein GO755_35030 [Spirosoma sp. HMF4905]|uniref:Uncharacterized protein n=1 Tax=Spirosoma arboris TaxID=2682092 RepID=A0A7K1SNB7_9BACT|nr:hypothetical protein [Spirosoma arboris]MVM35289.1 hypothetical protein [Spirosoma arboris]
MAILSEFSLNNSLKKIINPKIKLYFNEIKSSYENQNYRVAVVGLFSVAICDIIFKLQELKDKYNDESATKIIQEIESLQEKNIHSPQWEDKLIELTYKNTNLIEVATYANLLNLQRHRHLCAHPVIDGNFELFQPNQETAIAHIRNMLEGLFYRPIFASNKIFEILLQDIGENENIFLKNTDLFNYINDKYLKHTSTEVKKYIFKHLWKLSYRVINEKCNQNRSINSRALRMIYEDNSEFYFELISSDIDHYSSISSGEPTYFLTAFLAHHPQVFGILNSSAILLLNSAINSDVNKKSLAWFTANSLDEHLEWLIENEKHLDDFDNRIAKVLYQPYFEAGKKNELFNCFISLFMKSSNDSMGVNRIIVIWNYIDQFNDEQHLKLLKYFELSRKSSKDLFRHSIKKIIEKSLSVLGAKFDISAYPRIARIIE